MPETICCIYCADIFTPAIGQWTKWKQHPRHGTSTPRSQNYIFIKLFPFQKEEINNLTIPTHYEMDETEYPNFVHHLSATRQPNEQEGKSFLHWQRTSDA